MENKFIRADDVAQELSVSKPYAYKLINAKIIMYRVANMSMYNRR